MRARKLICVLGILVLPLLAACSSSSTSPPPANVGQKAYYSLDNEAGDGVAELGSVGFPLSASSGVHTIFSTETNALGSTFNLTFHSNQLWVVNDTDPNTVAVFKLPVKPSSNPVMVLTLPTEDAGQAIFDSSGNMWVSDDETDTIQEFDGPFTGSATLTADIVMDSPSRPEGIAFDPAGNLWVGLEASPSGIGEFVEGAGFTDSTVASVFLQGLFDPFSVAFDSQGNLYAGGSEEEAGASLRQMRAHAPAHGMPASVRPEGGELSGIGFWPPANQVNDGLPTVVNSTGMATGFSVSQLAFDSKGNLYDADCGETGAIYVWPTSTNAWSDSLGTSVVYSDGNISSAECAAGVAVP